MNNLSLGQIILRLNRLRFKYLPPFYSCLFIHCDLHIKYGLRASNKKFLNERACAGKLFFLMIVTIIRKFYYFCTVRVFLTALTPNISNYDYGFGRYQ